jgi:hypothetical protein
MNWNELWDWWFCLGLYSVFFNYAYPRGGPSIQYIYFCRCVGRLRWNVKLFLMEMTSHCCPRKIIMEREYERRAVFYITQSSTASCFCAFSAPYCRGPSRFSCSKAHTFSFSIAGFLRVRTNTININVNIFFLCLPFTMKCKIVSNGNDLALVSRENNYGTRVWSPCRFLHNSTQHGVVLLRVQCSLLKGPIGVFLFKSAHFFLFHCGIFTCTNKYNKYTCEYVVLVFAFYDEM